MNTRSFPLGGARAWLVWGLGATAFGYAFFQRVAPSAMVSDLMAEFSASAAVLGHLSALYFYPYVALQIPLGALLDRYGTRLLMTLALALAAVGSALFAAATSIEAAYAGRLLVGTGSAVGFLASISLASRWFPPHRFALMTGLTMFTAMACGIAGQGPLAWLVGTYGWRATMFGGSALAALLCVLVAAIVRDSPIIGGPDVTSGSGSSRSRVWYSLKTAIVRRNVWLAAMVAMSMTAIMLTFGGLWGVPYLVAEFGIARTEAAFTASIMLFGWAVGAPFFGWLSDRIGRRKLPLVLNSIISCGLMAALIVIPGWSLWMVMVAMFAIGAFSGAMVVTFALARELNEPEIHGTVSGIVNACTVASGAILQPVVGILLDLQWSGAMESGARVYTPHEYRVAFVSLVVWTAAGVIASLFLRETWCRPTGRAIGQTPSPASRP